VRCDLAHVETNIVNFDLSAPDAARFAAAAKSRGVLLNAIAPQRLRAVTHLDVSASDIDTALTRLHEALSHVRAAG
jgi:threonine aldolase